MWPRSAFLWPNAPFPDCYKKGAKRRKNKAVLSLVSSDMSPMVIVFLLAAVLAPAATHNSDFGINTIDIDPLVDYYPPGDNYGGYYPPGDYYPPSDYYYPGDYYPPGGYYLPGDYYLPGGYYPPGSDYPHPLPYPSRAPSVAGTVDSIGDLLNSITGGLFGSVLRTHAHWANVLNPNRPVHPYYPAGYRSAAFAADSPIRSVIDLIQKQNDGAQKKNDVTQKENNAVQKESDSVQKSDTA